MKDQIILTGIHGFGYHGVFDHERKDGQDFFVDLTLNIDLTAPSLSDAIEDTVNYAEITDLVVSKRSANCCWVRPRKVRHSFRNQRWRSRIGITPLFANRERRRTRLQAIPRSNQRLARRTCGTSKAHMMRCRL